jgi:hypothetical protein
VARAQNSGRQVIIGDGIRIELIVQTDAARRATLEALARSTTKNVTGPVPQRDLAAEVAAANAESQARSGIPLQTQRQKFPRIEVRHPENAETRTPK